MTVAIHALNVQNFLDFLFFNLPEVHTTEAASRQWVLLPTHHINTPSPPVQAAQTYVCINVLTYAAMHNNNKRVESVIKLGINLFLH